MVTTLHDGVGQAQNVLALKLHLHGSSNKHEGRVTARRCSLKMVRQITLERIHTKSAWTRFIRLDAEGRITARRCSLKIVRQITLEGVRAESACTQLQGCKFLFHHCGCRILSSRQGGNLHLYLLRVTLGFCHIFGREVLARTRAACDLLVPELGLSRVMG